MQLTKRYVPAVLDRQINAESDDAFGHRHFSQMLRGIIESEANVPPFSIGLLGDWGCGKSSIKSMYESDLRNDTSKAADGRTRATRVKSVTFNAWRFGGEDIKRALLRHVYLELGGSHEALNDALFRQVQDEKANPKSFREIAREFYDRWIFGLMILGFLYALVFFFFLALRFLGVDNGWPQALFGTASLVAPVFLFKPIFESDQRQSRYRKAISTEEPISSAERFEDLLIRQIKEFVRSKGKRCNRLVVFVDDLDRLSADEMISGLDAIRTFMEIPASSLPDNFGIVFVISCDESRVADALAKRHKTDSDLPATVFNQADARRYLDRIFQFRLEIPPFPKRDMRQFAEKAIRKALPELGDRLEANEKSLETLIDRMIHVGVSTPRQALQIVNAFVQSWWIAERRENDAKGNDREGGLHPGAVTNHPMSLAVLSTIRVDFPEFYADLQRSPDLVRHFTDVFVGQDNIESKPQPIQRLLEVYTTGEGNLRSLHAPLRQFMASLRGLRWPNSLRPLLFLSQDPVSRKFGDRAPAIYQAFISGDHVGVLAELGRQHDDKPLAKGNIRFLGDLWEQVDQESEIRRNNAANVLAELAPRFPADSAHLLLSPLARRLAQSRDLRNRLGIENIVQTLVPANLDDRKGVAQCLVDDLLKLDGNIEFALQTGELPSLDEAMSIVANAVEMVLDVRRDVAFTELHDRRLYDWLLIRRVSVDDKEVSLPFPRLVAWMEKHESWLLPFLGIEYTDQIVNDLSDRTNSIDTSAAIRQCDTIFSEAVETGEESRQAIWPQLATLIAAESGDVVEFARSFIGRHCSKANDQAIVGHIVAYSQRITVAVSELTEDDMALNISDAVRHLSTFIETNLDRVTPEVVEPLQTLIVDLASAGFDSPSIELLDVLKETFPSVASFAVQSWQETVLDQTLPGPCRVWLARNMASFDDDVATNLISNLDAVRTDTNIAREGADNYLEFVKAATPESLGSPEMSKHAKGLFGQIQQQHANESYVYSMFRSVPTLLPYVDDATTGTLLHTLFANTQNRPELFGWLCHWMSGHWPQTTAQTGNYKPNSIFDQAKSFTTNHAPTKWSYGVVQTMSDMAAKGIGGDAGAVLSACISIFPHHPVESLKIFRSHSAAPSVAEVAAVLDSFPPDNASHLADLFAVVSERFAEKERRSMSLEILSRDSVTHDGTPDYFLHSWIHVSQELDEDLLEMLLLDESLNDEQRKRVWMQIEQVHTTVGRGLFLSVIPAIAKFEAMPQTMDEVADFSDSISTLFPSADDRLELGKSLVAAFRFSASLQFKKRLAKWLHELDVDSVLKGAKFSEDDLAVLEPYFKKSKQYKQLVRETKKATSD